MTNPWDLKKDDTRTADSLPTFIIFCEDEVSEPIYFKYFETDKIKVNTVNGQKSKIENVIKAITHCIREDLMDVKDGIHVLKVEDTQVWCVFDRDFEEVEEKQILGDTKFNESILMATGKGIKVAWSNDAFELWILLHFEDIDPTIPDNKLRKTYYDRLTEIFKNLPEPNEPLTKALAYENFNYKGSMKQKNNFRFIVREMMLKHTEMAIARAIALENHHSQNAAVYHQKSPCTLVHHLLKELLLLGGKELPS